jgi:hypothetical protein
MELWKTLGEEYLLALPRIGHFYVLFPVTVQITEVKNVVPADGWFLRSIQDFFTSPRSLAMAAKHSIPIYYFCGLGRYPFATQ